MAVAVFLGAAIVAIIAWVIALEHARAFPTSKNRLPGPKGLPLIGNVHELPTKCGWMKFHEWAEQYGPIYQVKLAGTNHVWISRDNVAHDLLAKRSAIYSDRPFIPALEHDNRDSGQYLPLLSKNELWARQRKFAKQIMRDSMGQSFFNYPELEAVRLLFELMADASQYNHVMESFVARVTCRLAWATPAPADELKQRARELLIGVSPTGALGNKLPFIMSLPAKLVPAKAWELRRNRTEQRFFESMLEEVRQRIRMEKGLKQLHLLSHSPSPKHSWMGAFLSNSARWGFASEMEGAYAVGMHGIAGALTIAAPMQSFCLAMCHYPQYQSILHEELDRVLGDRMPKFEDMPDMPVLRSFIRETLRWRPPVPTGTPHELIQDDVYEGYHIPAKSVVHPLEWSISRDPEVFPDPNAWNPRRWLDPQYPTYHEPLTKFPTITAYSQFGYGRRTCLGMGVTEADLFVGIGSIAWLFNIRLEQSEGIHHDTSGLADRRSQDLPGVSASSDCCNEGRDDLEMPVLQNKDSGIDMSAASTTDFEIVMPDNLNTQGFPAAWPSVPGEYPHSELDLESEETINQPSYELDPTMNFSTLLIAKPMPFKFNLSIRNRSRAEQVAQKWLSLKMQGEFEDARVFWKGGNKGDAEFGWGEVFM